MSLLFDAMEPCVYLQKTMVPDGVGGFAAAWTDGAVFDAAIVLDNSTVAMVAEAQGARKVYRVYVKRGTPLSFHDAFRRLSDGSVFRVTSDPADKRTPDRASIDVAVMGAEAWEVPG